MRKLNLLVLLLALQTQSQAEPTSFARDIQPILAAKCFSCHGPDEPQRKAGLRLDDDKGLYAEFRNGGAAVVPHDRAKSALWQRINAHDADEVMPPPSAPKPLTPEEIALLGKWIDEGGQWEQHWSLKPLARAELPPVADTAWPQNELDRFVLAKLEERGMRPSPEADRRTLIRRVYFDLLGLPPTPEEVSAFVADPNPNAYVELVDHLLASPRHGERWARHWLDVARYGETHGYDKDKRRTHAWPYRDYVIRALNSDKPYGQFVREQIAGDVLDPASPDGVVATGFLAAGPWDFVGHVELREGTTDKNISRTLDRDDMVSSVMGTFASATVHCARCHDHKFDPILQSDYYALQAVFAGVDRANRTYDTDPIVHAKRQEWQRDRKRLEAEQAELTAAEAAVDSPARRDLDKQLEKAKQELAALSDSPSNGYHSAIAAEADVTKWVQVDLGERVELQKIRLLPAMPTDFPDTPGFGFPVRYKVELATKPDFSDAILLDDKTGADLPNNGNATAEIPALGKRARFVRVTATRLWPRTGDFVFVLAEVEVISGGGNIALGKSVTALDSIDSGRWHTRNLVDGFDSRRALASPGASTNAEDLNKAIAELEAKRSAEIDVALGKKHVEKRDQVRAQLEEIDAKLKALPEPGKVYAAATDFAPEGSFTPAKGPRPVFVLARGDVNQPTDEAKPGALKCVDALAPRFDLRDVDDEGMRRVALAYWLTDARNPFTWRSIVNRTWHYHFGKGIVETPNDFGRLGAQPTHPELLDWLATEFVRNGESLKWLHRLIAKSATYRQASAENADYAARDGNNQYLWRANRRLLDAESLRDAILQASGKIDLSVGGPSVDFFGFEDDHSPRYKYDEHDPSDPKSFRRSIYRSIVRSVPDPLFDTLDCADPSQSVPARNTTITALQALAVLNDKFVIQQAEYLAERLAQEASALPDQIQRAFRLTLSRDPHPDETKALTAYTAAHGLPATARLLLNLNEFSFVD